MNEADTRARLIDPKLTESGWDVVEDSRIYREYNITAGRIQGGGVRSRPITADYVLSYKGKFLAAVEAKKDEVEASEGVAQAKEYSEKLSLEYAYATNGKEIYQIDMETGDEHVVESFPTPEELYNNVVREKNEWREKFDAVEYNNYGGTKSPRFYQEIAVRKALEAVANNEQRILLTLATGTGKTFIAFQIVWKLFQSRWNLNRDGGRRPRILFLADRNILANQAYNSFDPFEEDVLKRLKPSEIKKKGSVPMNASIFFTIFQTFMSGRDEDGNSAPYFGEYPEDFFDFIIIDECHRGGANDESSWRGILEHFSPAVQLGLTATPKRDKNTDTYDYFGDPVYIYSLKEGINDGFLTPFRVEIINTTLDDYIYTSDDEVLEGEPDQGRKYVETDFNRVIEIKARERKRVKIFLNNANQNEKTIIFCANQEHAAAVRDLVNQESESTNVKYCVRVTANDGSLGDGYLEDFQDNEKTIPTVLTTSQKLSTGVDARNIRNIVLMRPVNSMIEFKQIIGRGTRVFEGKNFFTIYDFVEAHNKFQDEDWDGDPLEPVEIEKKSVPDFRKEPKEVSDEETQGVLKKIKIKLSDGKERNIQHMKKTTFWSADGVPISVEEFIQKLFGDLSNYFKNIDELKAIWSNPENRKKFLDNLSESGYGKEELLKIKTVINAENSDLYDVLSYIAYANDPITREQRVANSQKLIFSLLSDEQKEFIEFVLQQYINEGVYELDLDKLPQLLELKYQSLKDAFKILGDPEGLNKLFTDFQGKLYN